METTRIHAVMGGAPRRPDYVPINTHLAPAEAAYIIDNSNVRAVIGSQPYCDATLEGLEAELPQGLPRSDDRRQRSRPAGCATSSASPISPPHRIDDEIEGDLLQYLVGHHRP